MPDLRLLEHTLKDKGVHNMKKNKGLELIGLQVEYIKTE